MDVCLLAGDIMLKSGAETFRVEDTMMRIAAAFENRPSQCFVMPTGIIFSIDGADPTKLVRVSERSTDLQKVADVNHISRQIANGELTLSEAYQALKGVEKAGLAYSHWIRILSAAIASGCFLIMFKGVWHDFIPACLTGGIGFAGLVYLHRLIQLKFFSEFLASLIIGLLAFGFVGLGMGQEFDKIIIGSVMPLVPGVLITNAIRDLMAGHLVSGLSKGAEAFLTAFAIGTGIAFAFAL
nr:threonine/serine exporter family protein [Pullulanibacillus pueri]